MAEVTYESHLNDQTIVYTTFDNVKGKLIKLTYKVGGTKKTLRITLGSPLDLELTATVIDESKSYNIPTAKQPSYSMKSDAQVGTTIDLGSFRWSAGLVA